MKKSFVKSGALLMTATLIAKIIGAFYRIPLTNILGAEGMGVYQSVYPVYALILTASSGAIPLAISVLVSEKNANGNLNESRGLIRSALSALLTTGGVLSIVLVLLSGTLGRLQGNSLASVGYVSIAPSVLFVSGIAVLKGWFQGNHSLVPSALSNVIEAIVKLAVGLTLAYVLKGRGVAVQVAGALLGVSASEGVTFLVLVLLYRRKNPPLRLAVNFFSAKEEYKEILRISLPITLGGMIFPLTQFVDSFMVVNILKGSLGSAVATASYGVFSGPVSTLINLPVSLALAIGIAVVPHLAKDKEGRDLKAIRLKTSTAIKVAVLIGVPFAMLFLVAPREILSLLYGGLTEEELTLGAELLTIGAPTVIFIAITEICTSVLQGLKDTRSPIVNLLVGGVVKIISSVVLLYTIGIRGVQIAQLLAFTVTATLNTLMVFRLMGKNGEIIKNSGVILLFGGIIAVSLSIAVAFSLSIAWILVVAVVSGVAYLAVTLFSNAFSKEEILSLPFGKGILKLKKEYE